MDLDDGIWTRKCACGKVFFQPNSYSNHVKTCTNHKKNLAVNLEGAKERYAKKKKGRKGADAIESWYGEDLDVDWEVPHAGIDVIDVPVPAAIQMHMPDDLPALPLGRGLRARAPPQRFKDFSATSAIPFEIPMFGLELDSPPESPTPAPSQTPLSPFAEQRRNILDVAQWKKTASNGFNLYRSYWTLEDHPHDPDLFLSDSDFQESDDDSDSPVTGWPARGINGANPYHPFPNWSSFKLGEWYWSDDGGKSRQSFQRLVGIIADEDFVPGDIKHTNWRRIDTVLASSEFDEGLAPEDTTWAQDGASWQTVSVAVDVPFNSASIQPGSKPFVLENFRFRPLVPIILAKLQDTQASEHFHVVPSELWWKPSGADEPVRVHGELYHSDVFLDAYREIQLLPPEATDDDLPRCVVALMFASDETHLTSFGDAQIWPAYMHFGNESKHRRGKSSLKLFEEVAYFQKLPDSFNDWYLQHSGKNTVSNEVLAHVKREAFQAQWGAILNDEFVRAYKNGLVVDCPDGVRRRFYPRILTYAADYPERMRVVGLRATGGCPCPRCLITLDAIPQMGTASDMQYRNSKRRVYDDGQVEKLKQARDLIYGRKNYAVDADKVEDLLKPTSLTPAMNAFANCLSTLGFDIYDIPSVDILHEVELGVWKSLFIHCLRLLEAIGQGKKDILNHRYRQIPTFGRDTIRRFSHNVSDMKQLGGRDFEDLLQAGGLFPFEGLFPNDHDERAQDLFFAMAHWHALAKLRMHTDTSLQLLDSWTSILGDAAWVFVELTCSCFETRELKSEYEARKRKEARQGATTTTGRKGKGVERSDTDAGAAVSPRNDLELSSNSAQPITMGQGAPDAPGGRSVMAESSTATSSLPAGVSTQKSERKPRGWSLSTPKFHSLGDVARYIRRAGTTDSYSTQLSERFHRFPKSRYRRTNKKNVSRQISSIQTRQARIKRLRSQLYPSRDEVGSSAPSASGQYFVGKSQNRAVNLGHFVRINANDLATKDFLANLRLHLLPRIISTLIRETIENSEGHPDGCLARLRAVASSPFSEHDVDSVYFHSDAIYRHNILKLPFITYDGREETDTINPHTSRRDFICLQDPEDQESSLDTQGSSRYIYGRVLGIFHANVMYRGSGALDYRRRRFDFLWVRWFRAIPSSTDPWTSKRLDRIKFAPIGEKGSCGFIDPSLVLRGAHIIPRFALGRRYDGGKPDHTKRIFSKAAQDHLDWEEYYVNRFVDRDMTMRFHEGLAVGHLYSHGRQRSNLHPNPDLLGVPMDIDSAPSVAIGHTFEEGDGLDDSDVSGLSSGVESGDDRRYVAEPDSEVEPDIYD